MNYYEILGVSRNASQAEIKKAYKNLVKKYHPDVYTGNKSFAEKKTSEINVAYDVLCNPQTRKEYDDEIFPHYDYVAPNYNSSYNYNSYSSTNNRYNSTKEKYGFYSEYSGTKDGSEHDYSTYVNYGNPRYEAYKQAESNAQKRKTDYHSKFTSNILNHIEKTSTKERFEIVLLVVFIYIFCMLFFIMQFYNFQKLHTELSNSKSDNYYQDNSYYNDYYTPNDKTSTSLKNTDDVDDILHQYFTDKQLHDLYNNFLDKYSETSENYMSFAEFKEILAEYVENYY